MIGPGLETRCAIGRNGAIEEAAKREGDGATPLGRYPLRALYYRADRLDNAPKPAMPIRKITPDLGWCDAALDAAYNRPVPLPHRAHAERMWRADHAYDLVFVLGHNDDPVVPHRGSAIFFHVARPSEDGEGFRPTVGCVAIDRTELRRLADRLKAGDVIDIRRG